MLKCFFFPFLYFVPEVYYFRRWWTDPLLTVRSEGPIEPVAARRLDEQGGEQLHFDHFVLEERRGRAREQAELLDRDPVLQQRPVLPGQADQGLPPGSPICK